MQNSIVSTSNDNQSIKSNPSSRSASYASVISTEDNLADAENSFWYGQKATASTKISDRQTTISNNNSNSNSCLDCENSRSQSRSKSKTGHTIILYSALILSPSKSSKRHRPIATFLVDSDDNDNDNDDNSGRDSSSASSSDNDNNDKIVRLAI